MQGSVGQQTVPALFAIVPFVFRTLAASSLFVGHLSDCANIICPMKKEEMRNKC
jgi:hypothetical protein